MSPTRRVSNDRSRSEKGYPCCLFLESSRDNALAACWVERQNKSGVHRQEISYSGTDANATNT